MGHSKVVFGVAADLVRSAECSLAADPKKVFEDLVIALSVDTGLPRKEARIRLAALLPDNYTVSRWMPAYDELGSTIENIKSRRVR